MVSEKSPEPENVQTPIIGKYQRRLTIKEASRLQRFPDDFISNEDDYSTHKNSISRKKSNI